MSYKLREGRAPGQLAEEDASVRKAVEAILADVASRGAAAVRDFSVKFDGWDRADYRLTDREIQDCLGQLSARNISDIEFAKAQVKNFAEHPKAALRDLEEIGKASCGERGCTDV